MAISLLAKGLTYSLLFHNVNLMTLVFFIKAEFKKREREDSERYY